MGRSILDTSLGIKEKDLEEGMFQSVKLAGIARKTFLNSAVYEGEFKNEDLSAMEYLHKMEISI